jgi:hypothetical protein
MLALGTGEGKPIQEIDSANDASTREFSPERRETSENSWPVSEKSG